LDVAGVDRARDDARPAAAVVAGVVEVREPAVAAVVRIDSLLGFGRVHIALVNCFGVKWFERLCLSSSRKSQVFGRLR